MDEYLCIWGADYHCGVVETKEISVGGVSGIDGGLRDFGAFCGMDCVHGGEWNAVLGLF